MNACSFCVICISFFCNTDSIIESHLSRDVEKQNVRFAFYINKHGLNISKYFGSIRMIHTKSERLFCHYHRFYDRFIPDSCSRVPSLLRWWSLCIFSASQQIGTQSWFTLCVTRRWRRTRLNNRTKFYLVCNGLYYRLIFMLLKRI